MTFAGPVWLAVQEELLGHGQEDCGSPSCLDHFDEEALFQMFHLTRPCIAFITDSVRVRMRTVAPKKPRMSVDAMVIVTLNYYAHGVSTAEVLQRVGLAQTDCPTAVVATVSGVIAGMSDQFISFPQTSDARVSLAAKTEKLCGIPNVLGVLAPAHFKITAFPYDEDTFKAFESTEGYTSVVSQVICDSDGNILSVEKCCVGSTCEQEMWESSFKRRQMEKELQGAFWVVGGTGYQLSKHVLTPVSGPANDKEIRFNVAHSKIHSVMQTTLGSMKRRFKCLMQLGFAQEGSLDKKSNIIKACSVLHNIAKKFSVPPPPPAGKTEPLHSAKQPSVPAEISAEALKAREQVIDDYFSVVSSTQDTKTNSTEEDVLEDASKEDH